MREKCPNTEFFLVRMQENTGQKILRIWTFFTQYNLSQNLTSLKVGVPIADKIGRNYGILSSNVLWILASPHRTPVLEPGLLLDIKQFFF